MIQQDFSRPLILPSLIEYARNVKPLSSRSPALRRVAERIRVALYKAAEDGYLSWRVWDDPTFSHWFDWCKANRHPPVVRIVKAKYATLESHLHHVDAALPHDAFDRIEALMKTFAKQPKNRWQTAHKWGATIEGIPISDSHEAAVVLVDLLNECVLWGVKIEEEEE